MRASATYCGLRYLCVFGLLALALSAPAVGKTPPLPNPCLLLTDAQLTPVLDGKPKHVLGGDSLDRTYAWTGPPQGYMEFSQWLTVSINRETKAQFAMHAYRDIPKPDPLFGVGSAAFASSGGFEIWQGGFEFDLQGPYTTVYPAAAKRLARSALKQLMAAT